MNPASIHIILEDGNSHGFRTASIDNWDGLAIACPRNEINRLSNRQEVSSAGVYLLIGSVEGENSQPEKTMVYIGESENLFERIRQQHFDTTKADTWQWVLALGGRINKADALWLEWQLMKEVKLAGRVELHKQNTTKEKVLSRSERIKMEEYFNKAKQILPILGADFFRESKNRLSLETDIQETKFVMKIKNATAYSIVQGEKITILEGSTALSEDMPSLSISRSLERKTLIERGILETRDDGLLEFDQSYSFNSPSAAASTVAGCNVNGKVIWLVEKTQQTYAEWSNTHSQTLT